MKIRAALATDDSRLWPFLAIAAHEPSVESAMAVAVVAKHLAGWPRPGDFGVVADIGGQVVGAAWARQFTPEEGPYVWVDAATPEIAIGVLPEFQGRGVGSALLGALVDEARARGCGLCLNARDGNPAVRLYARAGFTRIAGSDRRNRVGGLSFGMRLDVADAAKARWRALAAADLPAVMRIADEIHPTFPESPVVFAERLALFPAGCFLAEDGGGRALGYAITHPGRLGRPPALDSLFGALPTDADCLHIHDVALLPAARGLGLGRALTERLKQLAAERGLGRLTLVAVYDAARYWRRHGFRDYADGSPGLSIPGQGTPELADKMGGYGDGAAYMVA